MARYYPGLHTVDEDMAAEIIIGDFPPITRSFVILRSDTSSAPPVEHRTVSGWVILCFLDSG